VAILEHLLFDTPFVITFRHARTMMKALGSEPGETRFPRGHRRIADIEHPFDIFNIAVPTDK
jgi:hypothetical protein